ncbi:MAG TPA: hypothetical protein VKB49_24270 [Candidatus Sulfotelmatobacter sp.]|nr:hypothetical protein [Candidatus Sulfotelmatobacter sp.]
MESSAEDAILVLKKWKDNSSMLRMVFGSDHVQMTLHGTLANVTAESIWAHGASKEENLKVSLVGARFAFVDERGLPPGFKEVLALAHLDEVISIVWPDGTRLTVMLEKEKP